MLSCHCPAFSVKGCEFWCSPCLATASWDKPSRATHRVNFEIWYQNRCTSRACNLWSYYSLDVFSNEKLPFNSANFIAEKDLAFLGYQYVSESYWRLLKWCANWEKGCRLFHNSKFILKWCWFYTWFSRYSDENVCCNIHFRFRVSFPVK